MSKLPPDSSRWSTPLLELKKRQIDSLAAYQITFTETQKDTQYQISVPSQPYVLLLILPPTFPQQPPAVLVKPANLQHPWINPQGYIVGHDKLQNWSQSHSLGRILRDIIQELAVRPPQKPPVPTPLRADSPALYGHPPPRPAGASVPMTTGAASSFPSAVSQRPGGPPSYGPLAAPATTPIVGGPTFSPAPRPEAIPPPIPLPPGMAQEFPGIEKKSVEEIEELLMDEGVFEEYFETLPQIANMKSAQEQLKTDTEQIANLSLQKEADIDKIKESIKHQQETHRQERSVFEEKLLLRQRLMMRFDPAFLSQRLDAGMKESDQESKEVSRELLEGSLSADDFVRKFRATRQIFHKRAAKVEKIKTDSRVLLG
ncbi:uncharacterized protein BJ171DRAFT_583807 [Polychytrium aggregatum]|uniref:uncharacterized protein n=1 Tax=Polychytrium aggregatum TaxID=110093 RepID=UPI0022FEEC37|nr:uncharacterized protein BJ171DRAFT_583807 [Polychytrium aggregatum]KAI9202685.1 hypothetical protein BJ171DRAFT_583807 [Polychytrium aggregatum]